MTLASGRRPCFVATIDVEGDNIWNRPRHVTTKNAACLPRFQELCEDFGIRPTYLTNYEMAKCDAYVEFARDVLARDAGEIGMHLHAWNSPPLRSCTEDDMLHQPYLIAYPIPVMREKVNVLTSILEETFEVEMRSHRAGRWAFNRSYARLLAERGYLVDCSLVPHTQWPPSRSGPELDYLDVPEQPYLLDLGESGWLFEIPMTVRSRRAWLDPVRRRLKRRSLIARAVERVGRPISWLRPNGRNRRDLAWVIAKAKCGAVAEFMLHSSELMHGGSPSTKRVSDVSRILDDTAFLFDAARQHFAPVTLAECAALIMHSGTSGARPPETSIATL